MKVSGIEVICDNCIKYGPQVIHKFIMGVDYDGDPMVMGRCPKCHELIELIFMGARFKDLTDKKELNKINL